MNKFLKVASLGAALCIGAALFAGCRNEKEISANLDIIKQGCEKAISDESGEILIYKTVRLDSAIEGVIEDSNEETFIQFRNNVDEPDFNLKRTTALLSSGKTSEYEFAKEGELMLELFDGRGDYATEAPDIFEQFYVEFDSADIKSVEVTSKEKGIKEYLLTMTDDFANTLDTEADGIKKDCTDVAYCYYIDNYKNLSNILYEVVYELTYDGQTQTLVEFTDAKID